MSVLDRIEDGTLPVRVRVRDVLLSTAVPLVHSVPDTEAPRRLMLVSAQRNLLERLRGVFARHRWAQPNGDIRADIEHAVRDWSDERRQIMGIEAQIETAREACDAVFKLAVTEAMRPDEEKIKQWIADLAEEADADKRVAAIQGVYREAWNESPRTFFFLIEMLGRQDTFLTCLERNKARFTKLPGQESLYENDRRALTYLLYRPVEVAVEMEKVCEQFVRDLPQDERSTELDALWELHREHLRLHAPAQQEVIPPERFRNERAGLSELFPLARIFGKHLSDNAIEGKFALTQMAIQELVTLHFGRGKTAVTTAGTTAGFNSAARAAVSQIGTTCDIFMGPGEYEPMVEGVDRVRPLALPHPDYSDEELIAAIRKKTAAEAERHARKRRKKAVHPHRMIFTVSTVQRMGGKRTNTDAVYAAIQELNAQYADDGLVIDLWVDASHSVNPVTNADLVFYSKGHTIPGRGFAVVDTTKKTNAFLLSSKGLGEHTQEMHGLGCIVAALACMRVKGAFNLHDYLRFPPAAKRQLRPELLNTHVLEAEEYLHEHCPLLQELYMLCISRDIREAARTDRERTTLPWRFSTLLRLQPRIGHKGLQGKWVDLPAFEKQLRHTGISLPIFSTLQHGIEQMLGTLMSLDTGVTQQVDCISAHLERLGSANILWSPYERDPRELTKDELAKSLASFRKKKRREEFLPTVSARVLLAFLQHILTQDSIRLFVDIKDLIDPRYLMNMFAIMEETAQNMQREGTLYLPAEHPVYAAFDGCTTQGDAVRFRRLPAFLTRKLEHEGTPDRVLRKLNRPEVLSDLFNA